MDTRRLAYLRRLGVDCYIPRDAAVVRPGPEPAAAPGPAAGSRPAPAAAAGGGEETAPEGAPDGAAGGGPASPGPPEAEPAPAAASAPAAAPEEAPAGPAPEAGAAGCSGMGWEELAAAVAGCRACRLCEGRTQTVFGTGDRGADLVVVGEGPGAEEDRLGEPFVGRAGKLLDAMLGAIHRGRDSGGVYIGNIVKCRPPGNRDPRPDEVSACAPYLRRQLELLQPRAIVALGRVAAQNLLASKAPLARLRGRVHHYADTGIPVWVTYHPAYLLRSPADKAKAWQDLKQVRALVEGDPATDRTPPA